MPIEIDMMDVDLGHANCQVQEMEEFIQEHPKTLDEMWNKIQAGFILVQKNSDGELQEVANQHVKNKEGLKQVLRQLNPQRLGLKAPVTAG